MTMTDAESQWLSRVMLTISDVACGQISNAVGSSVQNDAAEEVLRAAQGLVAVTGRPAGRSLPLPEGERACPGLDPDLDPGASLGLDPRACPGLDPGEWAPCVQSG
jgi:hypothetical protein